MRVASLKLEIDARGMVQGAQQASSAVEQVTKTTERAERSIVDVNVSLSDFADEIRKSADRAASLSAANEMLSGRASVLETRYNALLGVTKRSQEETDKLKVSLSAYAEEIRVGSERADVLMRANAGLSKQVESLEAKYTELAESTRKSSDSNDKLKASLFSLEGISERVTQKFTGLGKAAVGFFAADVVAKVVGFSSAMDLLSKASEAVADGLREVLGLNEVARQMEREKKAVEEAASAWDALARARDAAVKALRPGEDLPSIQGNRFTRASGYSVGPDVNRLQFGGGTVDTTGLSGQNLIDARNRITSFEAEFRAIESRTQASINDISSSNRNAGASAFNPIIAQSQAEIDALFESIVAQVRDASAQEARSKRIHEEHLAVLADLEAKETRIASVRAFSADIQGPPVAPGFEGGSSVFGGGSDFFPNGRSAQPYGVELPPDYLSLEQLARLGVEGGNPSAFRQSGSTAPVVDDRMRNILTGGGSYGFTFGNNEQTADLSRQLSQGLAAGIGDGIVNGDWKAAGQSVVQSIQGSLVQALVVEPFADFAAQIVQSILGALGSGVSAGQSTRQQAGNTP